MDSQGTLTSNITLNNTLILGGSFNPIHHGHLICARTSAEILGFKRVLLIPSGQPPHKPHSTDLAPANHRLAMCRRSVNASGRSVTDRFSVRTDSLAFEVSDIEVASDEPGFTLNTARKLKSQGMSKVCWLIGADQLNALPTWHEPQALLEEVHFVVMARPGYELNWQALPPWMRHLQQQVVDAPRLDISATHIRKRIAAGLPIDWLTPPGVVEYIREQRLYRNESTVASS